MHNDPLSVGYDPYEGFSRRWRDYLAGEGDRPGTFTRDVGTAVDQVPRWAWGVLAGVTGIMAYFAYRADKRRKGGVAR
jgi:hypothetical protein